MNPHEFQQKVWELTQTAAINQRYHQRLEWWWGAADKLVRILVGILAVASLVVTIAGSDFQTSAVVIGFASVIAAIVLNVIPLGDREKFYGEMFRRWSDFRKDAEKLGRYLSESNDKPSKADIELLRELEGKQHALDADEPAPWRRLLRESQEDQNESIWGEGIRTPEQVEAERSRRANPHVT